MTLQFLLFFKIVNMHTVKYFTLLLFFHVVIFSPIFFFLRLGYRHDCSYYGKVLSARENGAHLACLFMYKIITRC